ncbi:MAG: ABC transporter permease [Candidatus Krumholzibacteriia bacterium]
MRFVWHTAIKDWRRYRRDPTAFVMWIGIPLIIGSLIMMVSGGRSGPKPQAHVLVADEDDSLLSGLLVGALSQDAMGGLIQAESTGREEGRERVNKDKATALLIIPAGFGNAVLNEEPATLELLTNPSQRILPGIVEESLTMLVDATFYGHRLLGEDLKAFAAGPPGGANTFADPRIAEFSVKVNQLVGRLSAYLAPPVIQVETVVPDAAAQEEEISYALLFLPGILFMSLLFMAQGLGIDLWVERNQRTLRRVVVSPQKAVSFLLGKLLAGLGLILVVCLVTMPIGFWYFGLAPRLFPLAVAWTVFSGSVLTVMMMLIQLFTSSQRAAGIMTMAIMFPLMMVGGNFFPFEAMPATMAAIGRHTPNGWALEQLKAILLDRMEPAALARVFGGLLLAGGAMFLASARRLRSGFAQG